MEVRFYNVLIYNPIGCQFKRLFNLKHPNLDRNLQILIRHVVLPIPPPHLIYDDKQDIYCQQCILENRHPPPHTVTFLYLRNH